LILGGSDGPGLLAVFQVLQLLDVDMAVEDAGTLDAHANALWNE
jgi:hypothetical protein